MRDRSIKVGQWMTLDCAIPTQLPDEPEPGRRYQKADVRRGMFMTLDCVLTSPVPKYGEQPLREIAERLEAARKRLEEIREGLRRARRK